MGGKSEAGGARTGGASRAVDRTVFWNLVVHFREHCLPIPFLLADASAGEEMSPLPRNCSSHSGRFFFFVLFLCGVFARRSTPSATPTFSFRSVVFCFFFLSS